MKVTATKNGYFDHLRRREGDVFTIPDTPRRKPSDREMSVVGPEMKAAMDKDGTVPHLFSGVWMRPVGDRVPERISTAQSALDKRSNEIKQEKAGTKATETSAAGTGDKDVI